MDYDGSAWTSSSEELMEALGDGAPIVQAKSATEYDIAFSLGEAEAQDFLRFEKISPTTLKVWSETVSAELTKEE